MGSVCGGELDKRELWLLPLSHSVTHALAHAFEMCVLFSKTRLLSAVDLSTALRLLQKRKSQNARPRLHTLAGCSRDLVECVHS